MKRAMKITVAAIYARRTGIRAALAAERSEFCEQSCYAARGGNPSLCDDGGCWARSVGARSPILCAPSAIYAQRRLQLERGRTPAPRPRSVGDITRDYYTNKGGSR
jgi:hypothetical protein